ncbi:MAG: hypothetical protein GXY03_03800 [Solirubrobacterales bacterium]|nr:hypothetical protein [Solirubrobacterales bacterium]
MPRVAILGSSDALAAHAPAGGGALEVVAGGADLGVEGADAVVAFDPDAATRARLAGGPAPAILWLSGAVPAPAPADHLRTIVAGAPPAGAPAPWRTVPPPVADGWFADPAAPAPEPGAGHAAWVGPPTERRALYERHFGDAVEIAPDAGPGSDAAVAVHLSDCPGGGHGARVALARGRLLVSEPLLPGHGLEAGIDYLAATAIDDVRALVADALRNPVATERVRLLGRRKAELFRSSRVIARLVGDLLTELDAVRAR